MADDGAIKSFKLQVREVRTLQFRLDDADGVEQTYTVKVAKPDVLATRMTEELADADAVSATLAALELEKDFYLEQFEDEVADEFARRIADPDDDLTTDTLREIVEWAIGEGAGRPTEPSRRSSRTRRSSGRVSRPSSSRRG